MPKKRIIPRLIRYRNAPAYLGMDKNRFNKEVRPALIELPIGKRGIAFDRLDLDAWIDDYKDRNGCPVQRRIVWDKDKKGCQGSSKGARFGTLTKGSTGSAFAKALERLSSRKHKGTSFES